MLKPTALKPLPFASDSRESEQTRGVLIAPLWHTALLIAGVMLVSVLGLRMKAHAGAVATHHVREYVLTLGWEWLLAAVVLWGLSLRQMPVQTLLGPWRRGSSAWVGDIKIALIFWLVSSLVLGAVGMLLRLAHLQLPEATIAAIAPSTVGELLLFLALSVSAGFCEELLFRGYFQQQFSRLTQGRLWTGVLVSSLLFGCAHLYEGAAGVISITIFGAMFLSSRAETRRPAYGHAGPRLARWL